MTIAYSKSGRDDLAVLFAAGAMGTLSDAELLARFARGRGAAPAEAAFAALVDRHGPMVLGVCRRVTGDRHAADDAFQAAFLVLARRAHAVRLGVDDSLGRWLYRVSLRVARRARAERKRPAAATNLDGLDPIDPSSSLDPCERADLRAAIDAEIARLPARYRSAVVLCHLEGLSQEQAARRLRCPVGTVQSRLHRARERLRSGLARRGLAPAVGVLERTLRAAPPSELAKATAAAAARVSAGQALAGAAPAAVAGLAGFTLRAMIMRQTWMIAGLIALGLATTGGAIGLANGGGEPKAVSRGDDPKPAAKAGAERPAPPLAEKFDDIKAEYERAHRAYMALYQGSTIPEEDQARAAEIRPDFPAVVRRIADLAATAPKDPAVRDAMLWVIRQDGGLGPHPAEFALAAGWLVRHHGDDPDAVRVGLDFDNWPTAYRDHLLLNFYVSANCRESKGLARLALAQYLVCKARFADRARQTEGRPIYTHDDLVRADGTLYIEKQVMPGEEYAYLLGLKQCDVNYLRAEAERLYEEVTADYGDVPYLRTRDRLLEALLKQPEPRWNGEPLTDKGRRKIEARLASRSTLGQVAEARLDDWHNLAVGKPAPAIKGVDVHGKPLELSDYHGKVVALVFWGGWCGPCMREIPREKALSERMKGRPFAMLGVNTDADAGAARTVMEAQGVDWPNWHDGDPGEGPIVKLYHVRGYPTVYVIDAEGKIRSKMSIGNNLDELVEKLVAEKEAAGG
jgi:RNA polymerase sigma factor (sigma-70 family)